MKLLTKCSAVIAVALYASFAIAQNPKDPEKEKFHTSYPPPTPSDVCQAQPTGVATLFGINFANPNTTLDDWEPRKGVKLERGEKTLRIISETEDPYFFSPMFSTLMANSQFPKTLPGKILVKLVVRRENKGPGQIFFATEKVPDYHEGASTIFELAKDSDWHEYYVPLDTDSPILRLRFDIGGDEGLAEIASVELIQMLYPPVKFGVFEFKDGALQYSLDNTQLEETNVELVAYGSADKPITLKTTLAPGSNPQKAISEPQNRIFSELNFVAKFHVDRKTSYVERRFFTFNESVADKELANVKDAPTIASGPLKARFAKDGSGAEIFLDGKRVAVITPLIYEEGEETNILPSKVDYSKGPKVSVSSSSARLVPVFKSVSDDAREIEFDLCALNKETARMRLCKSENAITSQRDAQTVGALKFRIEDDKISFDFDAPTTVHAPVIRVLGTMEQALFPGVEYLEKGEYSSSTADIETKEAIRYAPPIHWVTQPFASIITDRASVSMLYDDPLAQPVFAVPDFLDGDASSSRINICDKSGSGVIRIVKPEPVEDAILWYLNTCGLPEIPKAPRSKEAQEALNLYGLMNSALNTHEGWVHALLTAGPPSKFKPCYGTDFLSAIWEITGKLPDTPRVDMGDAHIANYTALLLTGNGSKLVSYLKARRDGLIKSQKADGSFRYYGKFLKGSKYDYASGDCANKLFWLMDTWRLTGDKDALAAAEKGLAFLNKLRTPAGAQVWELSLHTPDIMGSSRCVLANVLAYEATGKEEYLAAARRWALTGVPFVYLWEDMSLAHGEQPMMKYATIAVFGATGWNAPNWMGRPVQWCGLDYAYALILLAKHDSTVDWRKIADGIVTSAECQLYTDEPGFEGLLPDSVQVKTQARYVFAINPTVVHMLRRMLDGKRTNVSVADANGRRIVAPYPMKVEGNGVKISAEKGVEYEIMIDGVEIVKIKSEGEDFYKP